MRLRGEALLDWLVARCNPIMEQRALRQISRCGAWGFSPSYWDGRETRRRALYPSYLFVNSPRRFYQLLSVDGVIGLVSRRTERVPFRSEALDTAVEKLAMAADAEGRVPAPPRILKSKFNRGDHVYVTAGVFRDQRGVFETFREGRSQVSLASGAMLTLADSDLALLERRAASPHN